MTLAPRPTLFITSPRLSRHVGLDLTLASETLQADYPKVEHYVNLKKHEARKGKKGA